MEMKSQFLSLFCLLLFLGTVSGTITLDKAVVKVNYVRQSEKIQRYKVEESEQSIGDFQPLDSFQIEPTDSISLQVSFSDKNKNPMFVKQLFLRIENVQTSQDNLYLLKKRGKDMRLDLSLKKEVQSDLDFWQKEYTYKLQVVMGDLNLKPSQTWTVTENMRFREDADNHIFTKPQRKVFDFDIGVKKTLLPEFSFPIPTAEKRATLPTIIIGLVLTVLPWLFLLVAWYGLGAFNFHLPTQRGEKIMFIGFELCILAHLVALSMFWFKWNIVTTGKVVITLMIPTLIMGRGLLPSSQQD